VPSEAFHDFFVAAAGVAGALIGLLFVAISVAPEKVIGPDPSDVQRVRAAAARSALTNALAVSLFGLIPGIAVGWAALVVAVGGLFFMSGAFGELGRARRAGTASKGDTSGFVGQFIVFAAQLVAAIALIADEDHLTARRTLAVLVVVCFGIGISSAWQLLEGPSMGLGSFLRGLRARRRR